jgi:hypothetical protein
MINHFSLVPFLAGLTAGFVFLYFYKVEPHISYKYPHPSNVAGRVYKDNNGVCYKYTSKEVSCDENEETLRPYPLQ